MSRGRSMPKGSSVLRKSSMARKSSITIPKDAFVLSVYQGSLYVGEGRAKEGEPGEEKSKPLFKLINAYFPSKICSTWFWNSASLNIVSQQKPIAMS